MRLNTLLALSTIGAGYLALTACSGEKPPVDGDADTDADSDADADADTDTDTDTDSDPGEVGFETYEGENAIDTVAGTYLGYEAWRFYGSGPTPLDPEDNSTLTTPVTDPGTDNYLDCSLIWDAANGPFEDAVAVPDGVTGPCADCDFSFNVVLTLGRVEPDTLARCEAGYFDFTGGDPTDLGDGGNFGYGWDSDYAGTAGPVASFMYMAYDQTLGARAWVALENTPATFDGTTFYYNWIQGDGYYYVP